MRRRLALASTLLLVACGSTSSTPPTAATSQSITASDAAAKERREREARDERAKKDALVASHRVHELEQQNAMAASCSEPRPWTKHERCLPSCYPTEQPAASADMKLAGPTEIEHVVCRRDGEVPYMIVDELDAKRRIAPAKGRFPRAHPKASWQAPIATWFRDTAQLPRTDAVVVRGTWRNLKHPLGGEALSCVTVAHYTKALRGKLGDCGEGSNRITCEAAGNGAARAINVVHYRVGEAKRLQAAGKTDGCQQAALEAIAVARGLPRWRQFKKLNVDEWNDKLLYKTRFDGILDEDALFAAVTALGAEAESIHAACGGAAPKTTVDQEQSFHMCW
jgi:hypothetical protein